MAQEFSLKPSLTVRQAFDDNIFLSEDNREYDFITRVLPSIALDYRTPRWETHADYTLEWWYYARLGKGDFSHTLHLDSRLAVIENFLFLQVTDDYRSVVLNPRRPSTETNLDINRSDMNTFTISPFVRHRLSPVVTLSAGYRYTNIWYREKSGTDRQQHLGFVSAEFGISPTTVVLAGAEYLADRPDAEDFSNNQTAVHVGAKRVLGPATDLSVRVEYRWFEFASRENTGRILYDIVFGTGEARTGRLQLTARTGSSASPLFGVVEQRIEEFAFEYGETVHLRAAVFHRRETYLEERGSDDTLGGTARLTLRFSPRLTVTVDGGYEQTRFTPDEGRKDVFSGSAELAYLLTEKATLSLSYRHRTENGRGGQSDLRNNIIALQMKTAL